MRSEHARARVNIEVGEDIRWLARMRAADLLLPGADCVVFHHRMIRWNFQNGAGTNPRHYTFNSDPCLVRDITAAFEIAWNRATPARQVQNRPNTLSAICGNSQLVSCGPHPSSVTTWLGIDGLSGLNDKLRRRWPQIHGPLPWPIGARLPIVPCLNTSGALLRAIERTAPRNIALACAVHSCYQESEAEPLSSP